MRIERIGNNTCIYRVILHPNKIYRDHAKGQSIVVYIQPQQMDPGVPADRVTHTNTILEYQTFKRFSSVLSIFSISEKLKLQKIFSCVYGKSRLGGFQPSLPRFQSSISVSASLTKGWRMVLQKIRVSQTFNRFSWVSQSRFFSGCLSRSLDFLTKLSRSLDFLTSRSVSEY